MIYNLQHIIYSSFQSLHYYVAESELYTLNVGINYLGRNVKIGKYSASQWRFIAKTLCFG
ncbi:hypothetical protein ACJX0J_032274, partial [Zea mays]